MIDLYEAGDYTQGIALAEKWVEQKSAKGENIYPLVYYYIAYGYDNLPGAQAAGPAEHYAALGEKLQPTAASLTERKIISC